MSRNEFEIVSTSYCHSMSFPRRREPILLLFFYYNRGMGSRLRGNDNGAGMTLHAGMTCLDAEMTLDAGMTIRENKAKFLFRDSN